MTKNTRYQISSRTEPANMVPRFKPEKTAGWWDTLMENIKIHAINLGRAESRVVPDGSIYTSSSTRKKISVVPTGRFTAVAESSAAYSMSVPAFNSQLG